MSTFVYESKHLGDSKIVKGEIDADTLGEAGKKLRTQGLLVLKLKEKSRSAAFFQRKKVSLKDKIIFTRQLSVMIRAGLSIVKALEALRKQSENRYFQDIITEMINSIKGGQTLSKTLSRYPKVFSEVYVAVVKAGEETGQMANVLLNLADQQEKDADLISKIKSAMIYPAVIMCTLIGVVFLIVFFVLPSLTKIFAESGQKLPIATRILLGGSEAIRNYSYIVFPVFILLIIGARFWFKTAQGRSFFDRLKISAPIFGSLTKKVYMARFTRTMAMLVQASLPILMSLKIVQKTINNVHYDVAFNRINKAVESGKAMSDALDKEKLIPPMVTQLVNLGEQSGNLETVLLEIANFYDKEVDAISRNLSALLEPLLLLVMGAGVALVVAAVLAPIYGMVGNFGG